MATVSESELEIFGLDGTDAVGGECDPAGSNEPVVEGALALQVDPAASGNPITREQRRSRRKREIRARTISVKRMTKRELEIGRMLYPETDYYKPRTRAECVDGPRPCPYVSCQHHLYLDVSARTGAIKLNFPDLEVWDMNETCALDVADRGGTTLEDVGAIMNLTRERIRQVEVKALAKLEALKDMSALRDYVDEGPVGKRRLPVLAQPEEDEDEDEDEVALDEDEEEGASAEGDAEDEGLEATPVARTAEIEDAGDFDGGE
ncbi:sigma factor-like helix-turn-helix DNA-binding protein [Sorangium sp. So ce291]|uniref:sigma factor-like helix-turn-helix DNA-binding protein n=1 Tax=Sorangium sp. So ce291 TaxID=3133294 RepID=UPI003F5EEF5E